MSTDPRIFLDTLHEICEEAEERFKGLTVCVCLPVKGQRRNRARFTILVDNAERPDDFTRRIYEGTTDASVIREAVATVCREHVAKLDRH
jgi:hypothetical protein